MEYVLGSEWEISPAGGATGDAYFAHHNGRKLFLKRNSSPFLAVLSAEGIVPKLIWTKRLENGDVITAQHWLSGRELEPVEMYGQNVAGLLKKIHHSAELLDMLKRLGKKAILPKDILSEILNSLMIDKELRQSHIIKKALDFLEKEEMNVQYDSHVVCHSDVNHNNWLLTDVDKLYLIDWDGAMIADPAMDLGMLLHWYIKKEDWPSWLSLYGITLSEQLLLRMNWYVIAQTVHSIIWYKSKNKEKEVKHWTHYLNQLLR
ncbi:phosphotransferase family protein [Fredinandcohnia quinoae]|uniref:Phosphotransferase family protein n=1 Tax=Fredinandcohnia quinoae TaxID=2918902 RepID=A0AAW5DYB0_9BACI|nr:phosphotransferase family protein [Fredinandcohnia sp. SECRCQ15]MCH1625358.1 phosphotransferase family protein [Fredinandcohnia sp. SECRCQ15]